MFSTQKKESVLYKFKEIFLPREALQKLQKEAVDSRCSGLHSIFCLAPPSGTRLQLFAPS